MLRRSIRSRTLALVVGTLVLSLSLISWQSYRDARHETEELFDAQLAHSARLVQGLVVRDLDSEARRRLQQALDEAASVGRGLPGHAYESKLASRCSIARGSCCCSRPALRRVSCASCSMPAASRPTAT